MDPEDVRRALSNAQVANGPLGRSLGRNEIIRSPRRGERTEPLRTSVKGFIVAINRA
ncbi:MAG: hypothetical protein JWM99_4264 [Verrucomicrobiales bacterium]|nr:hypothetical protein [Verrucomicrobiales bacterium]